ncbi:hypothetical protein NliqN6_3612 [Naganishia liquefaciens]|uniref:SigF-like NTF2-like domain-containing protein n=1 Tax=Naganishia liquefaciens TaxID=104408 RepID=A0A8H3TV06_9TREE|nr:hypothetical protein NliqN6_3612 [Naganishia liquefaciens]
MATVIIDALFMGDVQTRNEAIDKYFAEDAVYRHPLFQVKGKDEIKQAYDVWARMSGEKPKILNKLTSGTTCMLQVENIIKPLPFVSFTLPSITRLEVEPSTDAGTQIITYQEDTWEIRHIIENLPIYGWWHKNVVMKALSSAVLFTDQMMLKTDVVHEKYIAPTIAQGEHVTEEALHDAVTTTGKVAGASYQLVTDAAGKFLDYSSEAAGQAYATFKSIGLKTESKAEDVGLEGARQAGMVIGAAKSALDRVLFLIAQIMSLALQLLANFSGKAHRALNEGKARAKTHYEQGISTVTSISNDVHEATDSAEDTLREVKAEVVDQYSVGYKQGNKRGLFGLLALWADKAEENVPYADTVRSLAIEGKDRALLEGESAAADIRHNARKSSAAAQARLSALGQAVDAETGRFQEGFKSGQALGKEIEQDAPGQARAAYDSGKAEASDLTNDAIDMAEAALEKNKDFSTAAQDGLEGMRP